MKVMTHHDFHDVYTKEPAAAPGRIEAILRAIEPEVTLEEAEPAGWDDIEAVTAVTMLIRLRGAVSTRSPLWRREPPFRPPLSDFRNPVSL